MKTSPRTLIPLLGLLATMIGATSRSTQAEDRPPNVLLIISDDQAWTDYSFMGHPQIETPHIDRIAAEGLTFPRGYVPSSLCSPSLATIITGLFPHQHKVTSNDPPLPEGKTNPQARNDPDFLAQRREMIEFFEASPTLPRLLADRDYLSLQTGKWWGGSYQTGGFTKGLTHGDPDRGGRHGDEGLKIGREGLEPVFEFIASAREQDAPFFVWYAPFLPHTPHNPPERLLEKYRDKAPTLPIARYWAMCDWFDETCGALLDHLDEQKIAQDTLVVYVCDNGWIQQPDANGFAPRSKQSPHDGGLRTPIMIRRPGHIPPTTSDHLASSIDLAPTILAAAGLEPTPEMPGINLLDEAAVEARDAIFGDIYTHNAVDIHDPASSLRYRWVIEGDWKLILPDPRNEPDAEVELYKIIEDPLETRNLAPDHPEQVERLEQRINDWWSANG
ncbi:sulfatase [soil metagenome]